jgi:uncharacterized damage-inducible protein DinB
MTTIETFLKEIDSEAETTREMLSRVPEDKYDWQPHPKSMTVRQLATHIAELPGWITIGLTTDELDFAKNAYKPELINSNADLLATFEKNLANGREQLAATNDEVLALTWTMREGEAIYMQCTKGEVVRISISQTIHHRAQLGVFLRLLNIPIPGSYGPSADEMEFEVVEQA